MARVTSRAAVPILAVGGLGLVTLLAIAVTSGASDGFDAAVIGVVRSEPLDVPLSPLRWITELGSTGAVTLVAIVAIVLGVLIGPWLHGLVGAATIGLASLGNQWIKVFIARNRPDLLEPVLVERGFSFPSGHSLLSMVAYGVLGVLVMRSRLPLAVRRGVVAILGVVVLLVGVSRVWLGVHYPTDVLAGWTTGAVIVLVYARLTRSVSPEPAAAAVDVDQAGPRSDPPAPG
ncbi:MAG TPA: phosphatase PAP2 family protein [Candidatus Limnocylindrales bacterium]|nr:phosphatase PAP2 family protein [Candidatus Limnocylindrales bacterium]